MPIEVSAVSAKQVASSGAGGGHMLPLSVERAQTYLVTTSVVLESRALRWGLSIARWKRAICQAAEDVGMWIAPDRRPSVTISSRSFVVADMMPQLQLKT